MTLSRPLYNRLDRSSSQIGARLAALDNFPDYDMGCAGDGRGVYDVLYLLFWGSIGVDLSATDCGELLVQHVWRPFEHPFGRDRGSRHLLDQCRCPAARREEAR